MDANNYLPRNLFPPKVLEKIVDFYYSNTNTRIFNHSIAAIAPCRIQSMTSWAAAIDKLSWEKDILALRFSVWKVMLGIEAS